METDALLVAEDVRFTYRITSAMRGTRRIEAVKGVSLAVMRGELLAVVGESGSGKSTLGRLMVRLLRPTKGSIRFDGVDVDSLRGKDLLAFRGDAQIMFQNPYATLNPRMRIGTALDEVLHVWRGHRPGLSHTVADLLGMVQLTPKFAARFPHELSGGQRQRVALARSMAVQPRLLVADEPVSSLDVTAAVNVLNLLLEFRSKWNLTCVFITHDLGLARAIADRVVVMYLGEIVDSGTPEAIFERPAHDYTRELISAQLPLPQARSGEPPIAYAEGTD